MENTDNCIYCKDRVALVHLEERVVERDACSDCDGFYDDYYAGEGIEGSHSLHQANGCNYGQPDGPDDTIKECDCEELPDVDSITESKKRMDLSVENIKKVRTELEKLLKG